MAYATSEKTKRYLYEVATELFLQQGYGNTTIRQIAKTADVSTGTVYRYFPSKSDFLTFFPSNSVDHLKEFATSLSPEIGLIETLLRILMEDVRCNLKVFYTPYTCDGKTTYKSNDLRWAYWSSFAADAQHYASEMATRQALIELYRDVLDQAKSRGQLAETADTVMLSRIIVAIFFQESESDLEVDESEMEERLRRELEILFHGISPTA